MIDKAKTCNYGTNIRVPTARVSLEQEGEIFELTAAPLDPNFGAWPEKFSLTGQDSEKNQKLYKLCTEYPFPQIFAEIDITKEMTGKSV